MSVILPAIWADKILTDRSQNIDENFCFKLLSNSTTD